ncbi:MAG: glycosyl hydrolase family 18 protein [Bacteroidota bacterium]
MKKLLLIAVTVLFPVYSLFAQSYIHKEQLEYYRQFGEQNNAFYDSLNAFIPGSSNTQKSNCSLNKIVYGYHPYWSGSAYQNYRWDLLTDLCFFSYDVDSLTGNAITTNGWSTAAVVDTAQAHGVRVHLCATLMDGHAYFLTHSIAKQNLITKLIAAVQQRNAAGVNIDFEAVPSSQKTNLTNFLIDLCNQMHAAVPGSKVSIAAPAVNWNSTFDIAALNPYLDFIIIMGYDYYWSGSTQAGPVDGLYSMTGGTYDNLSRSITNYLYSGASPSKLILALPYYGREWHTTGSTVPSNTIAGTSSARTYKFLRDNSSGNYSNANKHWEGNSFTPYYLWTDGIWHQCFGLDSKSLSRRLDMVNMRGIAGMGMWALGYDDGYSDLWNAIESKLTNCGVIPCTDTIYDLGGPAWSYFNDEQFTYTIAPTGASSLSLDFDTLNLESGYDSLWIFDGPTIASPLIGGYSGTVNPGTIASSGNSLTLKFYSDHATVKPGWKAIWNCSTDNVPPTTAVSAANWETQNFTATFTDNDNTAVSQKFYQVLDWDGSEWRANGNNGFFNDNFNTAIHPEWHNLTGSWSINTARLDQTDEALSNTNIYANVDQTTATAFLYHWQMNIGGSGTNKRGGMHFCCDDPTFPNRKNSYMVYYRPDQDKVQIYKYVNDVMNLMTDDDCVINANTWYDCKVIFDRTSGKITAFLNDVAVSTWTDPSPYQNGNSISLRTGNASVLFDDVKVYKIRGTSANVSIGNSFADVRYQNPDPLTPSCRIKSIVTDIYNNVSVPGSLNVNIDWTAPSAISVVNDGTSLDIDTTIIQNQLSANWASPVDANSGIAGYFYCAGDHAGDSNTIAWTGPITNPAVTQSATLVQGNTYYFSVKAVNGAGLKSAKAISDGVFVETNVFVAESHIQPQISISPNPFTDAISISFAESEYIPVRIEVLNETGQLMSSLSITNTKKLVLPIQTMGITVPGLYFLKIIFNNHPPFVYKIVRIQ